MAKPRWTRRKDARPSEIVDSAIDLFIEKGFARTNLNEVAKRAGVAKGTLYLYFKSKEDLFRAAAHQALTANLESVEKAASDIDGSLATLVPVLLRTAAAGVGDGRMAPIARMVLEESRAFPELARIWQVEVIDRVVSFIAGLVKAAQQRGEVRPGDPRMFALSVIGPVVLGQLFHEVFGARSSLIPDLDSLARHHSEVALKGLLVR